jgi:hypothetical protein
MLPVDAYVAGPTEAAYLAQVGPAHAILGIATPEVVARPSATWIDEAALAALGEAGLDAAAVAEGAPVPKIADPPSPSDADSEALRRRADDVEALRARLGHEPGVGHGLSAAAKGLRSAADAHDAAHRSRLGGTDGAGRLSSRVARAVELLRPRGQPQERVLSPLSLVARHGVDALRRGLAELSATGVGSGHRIIVLR